MHADIEQLADYTFSAVAEGYDAFLLRDLLRSSKQDILYIVSDGLSLERTAELLKNVAPDVEVLKFPAWDTVPYDRVSPNAGIVAERVAALGALTLNPNPKKKRIVVASIGAVVQKLPPSKIFRNSMREIRVGGKLDFNDFVHYAVVNGYNRVEQVMEPGEYAVRGDILDIFPVGTPEPLRIDLFDDEVEKIRTFDAFSQRTTGELKSYGFQVVGEVVLDNNTVKNFRAAYREAFGAAAQRDELYEAISASRKYMGMENWLPFFYEEPLPSLFDYLPAAHVVLDRSVDDALLAKEDGIMDYYLARQEALGIKSASEVDTYRPVKPELMFLTAREFSAKVKARRALRFTSMSFPGGEGVINAGVIPGRSFSHAKNVNAAQVYAELKDYLSENAKLARIVCCYSAGSRERLFTLMSEYGIKDMGFADDWDDALKKAAHKKIALLVMNLPHGFRGDGLCLVSEQDILGERQNRKSAKKVTSKDFIADVSSLSVGELVVHIEHGIGRFLGLENITAGGAPHDCLKILYAGDAKLFVPVENIDVISRYGMEDDNIQLDTLGGLAWQAKKAKVKEKIRDIAEKLIKIAAERHLKVADSFVPPQGLYDEFCARFPFNETDDQLNAITDVLKDLNQGSPMDRLVCGDVGFGKTEVALRAAFAVAMSGAQVALIVPTTLLARQHYYNFKKRMEGFPVRVRMLSRLVTPKEAAETKKGLEDGSVEIVIGTHALLSKDIKFCNLGLLIIDEEQHFGVAHKEKLKALKSNVHVLTLTATPIPRTLQMSLTGVKQLEDVMNDFADGKADMLLSTTIIESGIDMPTVNTMIVHRSDMFGLAQLYQLKGRVGRSKVRGYCYFTVPKQKELKPVAERRLNILQALDTLGAGFSLASHDMDIRGSGNILGEEQSGHIKDVGIALYQHMLEEEIMRQKSGERQRREDEAADWAPQITTGIPIMIPETYVRDLGVRLGLYKRIGEIRDKAGILDIREELTDRFGKLPEEVDNLLKTVEIKQLCREANVEKIDAGAKGILITFHNNVFKAPDKLINWVSRQFGVIKIRPDQKLFVERDLQSYAVRVETIKTYVGKLVEMVKGD